MAFPVICLTTSQTLIGPHSRIFVQWDKPASHESTKAIRVNGGCAKLSGECRDGVAKISDSLYETSSIAYASLQHSPQTGRRSHSFAARLIEMTTLLMLLYVRTISRGMVIGSVRPGPHFPSRCFFCIVLRQGECLFVQTFRKDRRHNFKFQLQGR